MKKIILLTLIAVLYFQLLHSQEVTLRFQPQKGQTFTYSLLSEGTVTQSAMGMEQVVSSKTEARYSYFIQNVTPDGNVELIVSVDTVKTKVKTPMPGLDTTLVLPLGFRFKQILDKYGKSVSFEIIESKEVQLPGGMSRRIDKRNYSHSVVFPEKSVKVGDLWDFAYTDTTAGDEGKTIVKTSGKYVFNGIEEKNGVKCAKLNLNANFSLSGQGVIQGMNYGLEGDGKSVGDLWVDLGTGLVVHSETETEMNMAMGITGQVEMTFPMNQKFKSIISLLGAVK